MTDENSDNDHTLVKEHKDETYELMEAILGSEHVLYTFYIYGDYDDKELIECGISIHIVGFLSWKIEREMKQRMQEVTRKLTTEQFQL